MFPEGSYEVFLNKLKGREKEGKSKYLGVLFCDIRHKDIEEYIINYIDLFDERSGETFDFYLPGYSYRFKEDNSIPAFKKDNEEYLYNHKKYIEFCIKFTDDFKLESPPYTPTLILLEYEGGNFKNTKKVIYKLDDDIYSGIQKVSYFFDLLFKISKTKNNLPDILAEISKNEKSDISMSIIESGLNFLNIDIKPVIEGIENNNKIQEKNTLQ